MFAELMNLRVAVVASGNAVIRTGCFDLSIFNAPVLQSFFFESGLQKTAAAAAAIIVGSVGLHVDKIFFAHNGFYYKPKIFRDWIAVTFSDNLAGILNGEFNLQVFVPVGVDLEFAFTDPFCVIFVNVFNVKFMVDTIFFQSGPD